MSLDHDAIRARADAATEGPWTAWGRSLDTVIAAPGQYLSVARLGDPLDYQAWKNAEFIAHARTDIPALLDENARLRAALDAVKALHRPEKRWMPSVLAGIAANGLPYVELCTHCKTVEDGPCEGGCTMENGYLTSLWPCPTARALGEVAA